MEPQPTGSCACGIVRYSLASTPFDAGYCHCRTCQLNSGAPAMAFAAVPIGDFRFTAGEAEVKRFQSSSFGHRLFCGRCGTPIAMRVDDEPATIDFSIATLDDPETAVPAFHIFHDSRIAWFETIDEWPRHPQARPRS